MYNDLLIEFKNKKEAALDRGNKFRAKINDMKTYIQIKRKECFELQENQYDLVLKNSTGMINRKTGKQVDKNVI